MKLFSTIVIFALLPVFVVKAQSNSKPNPVGDKPKSCMKIPENRQFDFWLGDWDVFTKKGNKKAGTNTVKLFANGCGLLENWTHIKGQDGKSINFYDRSTKKWYQSWMGSDGGALLYEGKRIGNEMRFTGTTRQKGKIVLQKLTFTEVDKNTVRQVFEASKDDGKTWQTTYDLVYKRRK